MYISALVEKSTPEHFGSEGTIEDCQRFDTILVAELEKEFVVEVRTNDIEVTCIDNSFDTAENMLSYICSISDRVFCSGNWAN